MTIPDEAVQAASKRIDEYYDTPNCVGETAVRAALVAALPFLQGVKVKGRVFVVTALAQTSEKTGWRSRIIGAANLDEAIGRGLRAFEAGEQGANFCVPGAIEISAETLATAGILSAIEVAPSPREQALEDTGNPVNYDHAEAMQVLAKCACKVCGGTGERNDADCGDMHFNTWVCDGCDGQGWNRQAYFEAFPVIRALSSQPVAGGWLPIETAPKDGTQILIEVHPGIFDVVCWSDDAWREGGNFMRLRKEPTHWRPLPASPGASE